MSTPKVFGEFAEGLRTINLTRGVDGPGPGLGERFKKATGSVYDLAAAGSSKGDIWNWGIHDDALEKEIRTRIPGFGRLDTDGFSEQMYYLALRELPIGLDAYAGTSVLEVGCGLGEGLNFLSRIVDADRVIGLDLSPNAIERADTRLSRGTRLSYVQGDAENLPFEDGELDVVVNIESSHTYPDLGRFLSEVTRVLKPGGHFTHIDSFTHARYEQMTRLKQEAGGLEWIHERDISPLTRAAIRRRFAPGSLFHRSFAEKRMPVLARVIGEQARRGLYGAKFAGLPDTALMRALKKAGVLPSGSPLPDSYRHQIARKKG
ncbi:class I SAM-dependent methyltransferase [Streptomyces sp. GS7]|uniref:class I SAM-dependent methyltransferase n=1 Tax=Streptomyces sp. GS7 TaxID=2692234 RepID=UPI001316FA48|nr:class I SAM-dependent methyltransferase [Streptomyces sp. GS7]QHC20461.1 methyltransferase domain-containing protein [Streptomyces sp. GS7]